MYNPYSLEGKTILVTGASSGIGRATAIECSKMGAKVVVTARNEERLKQTLETLEGEGHQMILCDLTNEENLNALVENTPLLDGLVCNAGINKLVPIRQLKAIRGIYKFDFRNRSCSSGRVHVYSQQRSNKCLCKSCGS